MRLSTGPQLKGDGKRRQLKASRAYAEANGLELAEDAQYEDLGVSAFKGANVRGGKLGLFLDAVRSGAVKPGSYLLVESLDRLTRQELLKAQSLFLSIIQGGINVVTLADGRLYPAGTNDLGDLIYSLVVMARAHEESQIKSQRIGSAWKNKRTRAASQVPMTKWCPAWLTLAEDRTCYEPNPERVEIVRGIFEDAASGMGVYSIATGLNQRGVPTFDSPNGWHTSYVAKILCNRAVLGEFQPHRREAGKRVPDGEPSRSYYPAIIDEAMFYRVQLAKSERRVSGKGRKGTAFTNLFSGLAVCAYCNSPMKLENKGSGRKGGIYLVCDGVLRKLGCPGIRWRYRDFETSFLAFVEEVDLDGLTNEAAESAKLRLESDIAAIKGELAQVEQLMEKTFAVLTTGGPIEFVTAKLKEQEARKAGLLKRHRSYETEREQAVSRQDQTNRSKEEIRELVERVQRAGGPEMFKLRARLASHLKVLVEHLFVATLSKQPKEHNALRHQKGDGHYFEVWLRYGPGRAVYPTVRDPLRYDEQIVVWDGRSSPPRVSFDASIDLAHISPARLR
ncbi:DNA invertase Pin-like site-specific DNA recombinase [Bradyrhizobium elkanii]|uniref:recombinase family protein n=1 Tax=Bradyrhizobium elkanii TaxID=29448 RepID=UPI00222669F2|nr:recombinase family protein [Bradyrhizobium elkanii]MCW2205606.1 DNA invertase Pin-like site-specific DNA recombinase [Bradyrhizobium elkanii]